MSPLPFRTRIKLCGMTRAGDVRLACELGVDAVGFIFAAGSPRHLRPREAGALRAAVAPLVDVVAVFRNNTAASVRAAVEQSRPSLLQFHGDENDAFCRSFGLPWIKAVAMGGAGEVDAGALRARYPGALGFLFDSHGAGVEPGRGQGFDWSRFPRATGTPLLLAGGLGPDNVYGAVLATRPWAVDACSGVERGPGIKDAERMRHFIEQVRRADDTGAARDDGAGA